MNSGRTAVLGDDLYIGNSSNSPVQIARTNQIPVAYTHPSEIQCDAASEIEDLKSSVSSGKASIASAITDKGISTSSAASFSTMATNIRNLDTIDPILLGVLDAVTFINVMTINVTESGLPSSTTDSYGYTTNLQSSSSESGDNRYEEFQYYSRQSGRSYWRFSIRKQGLSLTVVNYQVSGVFSSVSYSNFKYEPKLGGNISFTARVTLVNGNSYNVTVSGTFPTDAIEIYGGKINDSYVTVLP